MKTLHLLALAAILGAAAASMRVHPVIAQPQPAATSPQPTAVESLRKEADSLRPLVQTDLARSFLAATDALPLPETRVIWRNLDKGLAYTSSQYAALPEKEREGLQKLDYDAKFYYYTGYGSPLVYARPLDLLAATDKDNWTPQKLAGKRIAD